MATVQEVMDARDSFEELVPAEFRITNSQLHTLQVNVGYKCNIACRHCHLQCGPNRTEVMSHEVMQACLDAYKTVGFTSMDVTGGAPEMHPELEWFLREAHKQGVSLIVRTNLCILADPAYAHFAALYDELGVTLYASLPYYSARNVDKIRGRGTFDASIEGLRLLNEQGFGTGKHTIVLVFNPSGATMPPAQASMELEYKRRLEADFGVHFDSLVCIANNPSGRFAEALNAKDKLGKYLDRLIAAFNPGTLEGMMCRDQLSVDYQGALYDCDFNQALGLKIRPELTIFDLARDGAKVREVVFANHCYGCTAGAGSSCGGETA